ncbi:hypothetical protein FBY35_0671 [Streptomyces sp. SLBN-118]|nr:hypothetical protein FBY35_0671 [Streptomyces sp. SLBN-118]
MAGSGASPCYQAWRERHLPRWERESAKWQHPRAWPEIYAEGNDKFRIAMINLAGELQIFARPAHPGLFRG